MNIIGRGARAAALGFGLLWSTAAAAEQCHLSQLASLDVTRGTQGELLVPLTVEGVQGTFELSPTSAISAITATAADSVHLRRSSIPQNLYMSLGGQPVKEEVTADLKLGGAKVRTFLAVSYGPLSEDPKVAGIIAFDILKMMDLELDLAHGKVNLFSQDHCPKQVIYWTHSAPATAIPLDPRGFKARTIVFDMELDGQELTTQIEPSMPSTLLSSRAARQAFGIPEDEKARAAAPPHIFNALSANGITILHPSIGIYEDSSSGNCAGGDFYRSHSLHNDTNGMLMQCFGNAPLFLGYSELAKLRMYFAFGEQMLYVTAADAH